MCFYFLDVQGPEVAVEELVVASAHSCGSDLQENLVRPGLGEGYLFDSKEFVVSVHPGCSHLHRVCLAFARKRKAASAERRGQESGSGVADRGRRNRYHHVRMSALAAHPVLWQVIDSGRGGRMAVRRRWTARCWTARGRHGCQ
jgi:hypothetical protein